MNVLQNAICVILALSAVLPPAHAEDSYPPQESDEGESAIDLAPARVAEKRKQTTNAELSPYQKRVVELIQMQLDMTRNSESIKKTQINRDKMIILLEKFVEIRCMPKLARELEYEGEPRDESCVEPLNELLALHPENPIGLCAKHGLSSASCIEAYEDQYIDVISIHNPTPEQLDLQAKFSAEKNEEEIHKMRTELRERLSEFKYAAKERQEELRRTILKLHEAIIPVSCEVIRTHIVHQKPDDKHKASAQFAQYRPEKKEAISDLLALYDSHPKSTAKETPKPRQEQSGSNKKKEEPVPFEVKTKEKGADKIEYGPTWRVRALQSTCKAILSETLQFNPDSPTAICYYQGFSAPQCIAAKRKLRDRTMRDRFEVMKKHQKKSNEVGITSF